MEKPPRWKEYLYLVEFSYNNGHHTSLAMIQFEALYGIICIIPLS